MENLTNKPAKTKPVNKENYELFEFNSGYFGICEEKTFGGVCVFGGDSAWTDCYNKEFMEEIFSNWDGELFYTGDNYGYKIEL